MSINIPKMKNHPTIKKIKLPIHATAWISKILCYGKKLDTKEHILYDYKYIKFKKVIYGDRN